MAKLPIATIEIIIRLKQDLLAVIDEATAAEFLLLSGFGETDETLPFLDEMKNVAEQAVSRFSQITTLQLRIAESQPNAAPDMLELLDRAILQNQQRIPAWERSIQEVKLEWNLL